MSYIFVVLYFVLFSLCISSTSHAKKHHDHYNNHKIIEKLKKENKN